MLKMSQAQLDDFVHDQSATGEIPIGEAKAPRILAPGTTYTHAMANFQSITSSWQGKISIQQREFAKTGKKKKKKKILGLLAHAIIGHSDKGPIWLDSNECHRP